MRRNLKYDEVEENEQDLIINELWVLCNDFRKQLEDAKMASLDLEDHAMYREALAFYAEELNDKDFEAIIESPKDLFEHDGAADRIV